MSCLGLMKPTTTSTVGEFNRVTACSKGKYDNVHKCKLLGMLFWLWTVMSIQLPGRSFVVVLNLLFFLSSSIVFQMTCSVSWDLLEMTYPLNKLPKVDDMQQRVQLLKQRMFGSSLVNAVMGITLSISFCNFLGIYPRAHCCCIGRHNFTFVGWLFIPSRQKSTH